jgi:hypothetical protein
MTSEDEFNDFVVSELIDLSSSEDEEKNYSDATDIIIAHESLNEPRRGVRLLWHNLLYRDYFSENLIFGLEYFRWRLVCSHKYVGIMVCPWVMVYLNNIIYLHKFRMSRHVFVRIMNAIEEHDDYFIHKRNTTGTLGLSCLQKVAAALDDS